MQETALQPTEPCLGDLGTPGPPTHPGQCCVSAEGLALAGVCGLTLSGGGHWTFWMPQEFWAMTSWPLAGAACPEVSV